MDYTFDKLKELNLSRDEVDRIGEALKKEEFRKLLTDYVEELQDPENKKLYEEEITQLEKERGVDVTFIHPKPGYVIKTSVNGNQKAFINICANDHIKKPSSSPTIKEGAKGLSWSLPHSLSPPREDIDNKRVRCQVFDIVFHSDTLHLAEKNNAFRTMVNNTALEAVEASFDVKLDKKNLKFPKLSYKGMAHASVIRKPSESGPIERLPEEKEIFDKIYANANNNYYNSSPTRKHKKSPRKSSVDDKSNYTTPVYSVKHRSHVDIQDFTGHREAKMNAAIPKELIVEINLPLLKSSTDITLDVTEKTIQLLSEKPARYKLNLTLPYSVNESSGNAKFDKDLKKLVITLPVRRNNSFRLSDCKDDSGVESDQCAPETPESEDEKIIEKHLNSAVNEPSEKCLEKSTQFRTKFLDDNVHYTLPEFTCHVFENVIAFTLHVKNVDENSVGKLFENAGSSIHVKFTSIGSSFYPNYYAFCVKFPSHEVDKENTTVEVWDNNVVLQVSMKSCDKQIQFYLYGISEDNLLEKYVEEPDIINQVFQETVEENQLRENEKQANESKISESQQDQEAQFLKNIEENTITNGSPNDSIEEHYIKNSSEKPKSRAIDILCTSYESSGDELSCSSYSPRKSKGILKRLSSKRFTVGRSISESSLDDFVCSSSFENCHMSLDSVIPEDGEVSTSLKKTVRFNDVVTRQLFRSNSSILGQKKKNQRKSKNKKRALERRHSESENSEVDDKKEGDIKDCRENDDIERKDIEAEKKEDHDIFHLDIDN